MQTKSILKNYVALILSLASMASILTACASGPYPITSSYYQIPVGSHIELTQTLTILPNTARVYLQYGKVVSPKEKDRYQPNCWFLSWKVLERTQTILPDTFIIKGSEKSQDLVQNISNIKFASRSMQVDVGVGIGIGAGNNMKVFSGDVPMAAEYTTTLQIYSDKQPDIQQLACSHWDDPSNGEHLTVEKMQQALGNVARIVIN